MKKKVFLVFYFIFVFRCSNYYDLFCLNVFGVMKIVVKGH